MGKAGGILGIIAGIFGVAAALFTLLVGGVGAAFQAKGAETVVGLGWGGVLFSFLVIVFGAVAFARPKGAGLGLVICSIGGAILGGTFVAVAMVLSLIGGVLCLLEKSQPQAASGVVGTAAASAQPQGKPWGIGRMIVYSIFSFFAPLIGVIAGIYGLVKDETRKQGAFLLVLAIAGIIFYAMLGSREKFVTPDDTFLQSELMVRAGISEVGLSVGQFVEVLNLAKMDNGRSPELKGWTKEDNEYTLHVVMKQPVELKFTYMLAPPVSGRASVLAPVRVGIEEVPAMQFLLTLLAMVPEQSKPKRQAQQAPAVAPPQPVAAVQQQAALASPSSAKEVKARFGVVTIADDGVRKLQINGTAVTDSKGNPVESDHLELVKHFALPDMDVFVIYSNCGGTACAETGRYQFLILGGSGQRSLSAQFGDGRDNATIQNDGGKIVVGFGAKGMAILDGGSIRVSKELLP